MLCSVLQCKSMQCNATQSIMVHWDALRCHVLFCKTQNTCKRLAIMRRKARACASIIKVDVKVAAHLQKKLSVVVHVHVNAA